MLVYYALSGLGFGGHSLYIGLHPMVKIDSPFKPSTERLCIVAYHPADAIIEIR